MLKKEDIAGFIGNPSLVSHENYLVVTYTIQTNINPLEAAANLCCELSTAQWARVGTSEDFREKFGAKVMEVKEMGPFYQIRIASPHANFGANLPGLLSALAGEGAFYSPGITLVRLEDIEFPKKFLQSFEGPQFGVKGLRDLLQIQNRPLFLGVIKPPFGLSPNDYAGLAYQAWLGGLDIAKDDEMLGDITSSPFQKRVSALTEARQKVEKETGKPKMMIANLTAENDDTQKLYDLAVNAGANAVMLNGFFTGFSSIRVLRKKSSLPIMGHFAGMALYNRTKDFGMSGKVLVKLQRLAGCDLIGLPGFGERMHEEESEVLSAIKTCLEPMDGIKPSLPIPGGSDSAKTLASVCQKVGHIDFGFISGRGIFGHPLGPRAGAKSICDAWEAYE